MDQNERPQYYEGQYLGAEDLAAIVTYARVGQARHALGAHTWGIALGLELVERPLPDGAVEIVLTPGFGWDGIGRPIVALAPAKVGLTLFQNFQDATDASGVPVEIWLSYHELPTQSPAAGFAACREGQLYERVIESYSIEALRPPIDNSHSVSIAARTIDPKNAVSAFDPSGETLYDESVPYQDFPASGDLPRWRLFVGVVRWANEPGKSPRLIKRTDDDLNATRAKRRYVGVVSECIQAPDGVLRLRDRGSDPNDPTLNFQPPLPKPPTPAPDQDLVWVEGNLRVIGDARLVAGKLDYRVTKGGDDGIPIWLRRIKAAPSKTGEPTKITLEAVIGPPPDDHSATRFAVTAVDQDAKNPTERLTVVTDGHVGINAPDPTNTLHVDGETGIRHYCGYISGDDQACWTSFGYNAFYEKGDTWHLVDPAHKSASIQMDDTGGVPNVRISTNASGDPSKWDLRLIVKGDSGNVGIGLDAPTQLITLGGDGGTRLEIGRVSSSFTWCTTATANPGSFAINQQSAGSSNTGADFALKRDGKLRVVLGDSSTFLSGQDGGDVLVFANRGEAGEKEVLRATAAGNVGIGTASPAATLSTNGDLALHQVGTGSPRGLPAGGTLVWNDGTWLRLNQNRDYTKPIFGVHTPGVLSSGSLNVGGVNGWADPGNGNLWITGSAWKNTPGGSWDNPSDERLKKDIAPIEGALAQVLRLRGVSFSWLEPKSHGASSGRYMGMLAQQVEKVFPEWVREMPTGFKSLNPVGFEALVVEAMRELKEKCDRLEKELKAFKAASTTNHGPRAEEEHSDQSPRPAARRPRKH